MGTLGDGNRFPGDVLGADSGLLRPPRRPRRASRAHDASMSMSIRTGCTIACVAACLLSAPAARAQNPPEPAPAAAQPGPLSMSDCHPSSFGKLVDVTTL